MGYNNYNYRRRTGYQQSKTPSIAHRLLEQFLTQCIICIVTVGIIFGSQLLNIGQVEDGIHKIKSALTYSPSLDQIIQNAKRVTFPLIDRDSSEATPRQDDNEMEQLFEIHEISNKDTMFFD